MTANSLDKSTSPYLLLHKDNPVAWREWSQAALDEAAAQKKPVLLSIGYSGCHWCHVMNRESFSDAATAAFINAHYIPVLVDREERPDVDYLYQTASGAMGHSGGWPLTMFLNGEGKPIFAAGFLPKEESMGQPPFMRILTEMAEMYTTAPEDAAHNTALAFQNTEAALDRNMEGGLELIQLDLACTRIGQRFDIFMGGLTGFPKFANAPLLETMWRAFLRSAAPQYLQLVSTSMDGMLFGGLYDHVGGGFFRYAQDERWMVPHFEKALSDNAQLVGFMTAMWQFNRNELCRVRVAETIEWIQREMQLDGGGFASGLDSDSEGEEGKFYLWSEAEVDAGLQGTFSARFKQVYGIRRDGEFNGKSLPRRLGNIVVPPLTEADEALLVTQRAMLLAARNKRKRPRRGETLLADVNGIAIRALALAGAAFERAEWVQAAVAAFDTVIKTLGEGEFLYHSFAGGKRGQRGYAEDYAHMANAALALYEATGEWRFVEQARIWTRTLDVHFWSEARGGYFMNSHGAEPLIIRPRTIYDDPMPSANAIMISVNTKLALLTVQDEYGIRAQGILNAFADALNRNWIGCGEYLNGFECFASGLQLVVIGDRSNPRTQELLRAIWGKALPNRLLTVVDSTDDLPEGHALNGKGKENGQPTVYVCQRNAVSQGITSAVNLSQMLSLPVQRTAGAA